MPEALARAHHDSTLSRPARGRGRPMSLSRALLQRLKTRPARTIAGAAMAALMTGVVVNALVLQKSHRVAISPPPAAAPAPAISHALPAQSPMAGNQSAPAAAPPPARPTDLGASNQPPAIRADQIGDLLRAETGSKDENAKRLTLAAQTALIKLGYSVRADGVVGGSTLQAIEQFERAHGFIPRGEITPKIVKELNAAAAAER